jgi:hypothetical protein
MDNSDIPSKSNVLGRGKIAEDLLKEVFERAGWKVEPGRAGRLFQPDMVARRRGFAYAVEVKSASEGRGDRLIPLFAQAVLQSARAAGKKQVPLAVVAAPKISPKAAEQVIEFAENYAPDAAVGVVDFDGLRMFRGPHLEGLNAQPQSQPSMFVRSPRGESGQLFSDLNQWMLKVLLAQELPDALLNAPRGQYRNASQLARAAQVSVMSAFRFVQQLHQEGYLHESAPFLNLVRRKDLFRRWQASAQRPAKEVPMRFLLPGDVPAQIRKVLDSGRACLALFAAADAVKLGFVHGVPPYVYVERVGGSTLAAWKNLQPCGPGEPPHLILRQAASPQSVFRGMVRPDGLAASDVLQVWLDVAEHPSRGREQADLIRKRVLGRVIEGGR